MGKGVVVGEFLSDVCLRSLTFGLSAQTCWLSTEMLSVVVLVICFGLNMSFMLRYQSVDKRCFYCVFIGMV